MNCASCGFDIVDFAQMQICVNEAQARVKELASQVETCRENEVRLCLENAKLKRELEELKNGNNEVQCK